MNTNLLQIFEGYPLWVYVMAYKFYFNTTVEKGGEVQRRYTNGLDDTHMRRHSASLVIREMRTKPQ